jgi:hypothetical protein
MCLTLPFNRRAPSASLDDIYWQLTEVTWEDPPKGAHVEVLASEAAGLQRSEKLQSVVKCSSIASPQGGTLHGAGAELEFDPR